MKKDRLSYGMVGGDLTSFIGNVHRRAIGLEPYTDLVAGCFSSHLEKNEATGKRYVIDPARLYPDYRQMALAESERPDKIDFVVVSTPNNSHYEISREFLVRGIPVFCEKPLTFEVWQAEELARLAAEKGLLFGVAHAYSGYPMVKQARQLVAEGQLGEIFNVNAEYPLEWLIDDLNPSPSRTAQLAGWRTDPTVAGIANCTGDIATHIEHTVAYITGLRIRRLAARVDYFGHPLDLNVNLLLEFSNGASGVFWSSDVAIGHRNGLRVRIYGTQGSLEWYQEEPECLRFTPRGEATRLLYRGTGNVTGRAAELNRIPSGHIEGHYTAFANLYRAYMGALLKQANGEPLTSADLDFPSAADGIAGVKFIHAVIESGNNQSCWVDIEPAND